MVRWILITIMSIGVIGLGVWGYQEHEEKNAVLIQAENNYQRAFHELSYHMDLLHDKIGASLAMNSDERLSPQLVDIWRLTSESLGNVGQLPLTLLPFNETETFLSDVGDFTYRTAVRDLKNDPLTDEEIKTLESLYEQAGDIKSDLREVQNQVLNNDLRWMDVELALATEDEQVDNTIIDGLKTVEEKVEGFAEGNSDTSIIGDTSDEHEFLNIEGENIDEKEALKKGKDLFSVKNEEEITINKSGEGADVSTYNMSYKNDEKNAFMDITEQGGHPITLLVDRPVKKQTKSLNEGLEAAEEYIKQFDFDDMTLFESNQYDNIGVYSFVYNDNGVRVFSDGMEIKVALDNLDVLGFNARNYFMNHRERNIKEPEITSEEARQKVNEDVELEEEYLAVIDNDLGEEVLTYEFLGTKDQETYRIFINAMNGTEEKVEKLSHKEVRFE